MAGTTLAAMYASEFAAHGNDAMFRERIQVGLIKVNGAGMWCSAIPLKIIDRMNSGSAL